jgi:predicted lipid-binding transport protein (Tim44 family)
MKRSVCMLAFGILLSSVFLTAIDTWARAGSGGSSGSRGSRSYSAPARPSTSPPAVSPSPTPPTSYQQSAPQRSGWMGGLMGGLGGLLLGGFIGSLLFGHGFGGGIGLLEIVLIGTLAFFAIAYLRRRQESATVGPAGYAAAGHPTAAPEWRPEPVSRSTAAADVASPPTDLDHGLRHIARMDPSFVPQRFTETASDIFFKVQAAWMTRDMASVTALLTPEMLASLQKDCDRLRAERKINRLENIAVRSVELTEAWQETGQDFATVHFLASLLDYTTDEDGHVLEGSRVEPVKFEEFWTFTRPVGPNAWRLSAIQQAT